MTQLFIDDLTVIDCSILDRDRGLTGSSWMVDLELSGDVDEQGMLFDFGLVKKQFKNLIDEEIDHRLVVPVADSQCTVRQNADSLEVEFRDNLDRHYRHVSPRQALCLIDSETIDGDVVADWLQQRLLPLLPANVTAANIVLRKEEDHAFFFHYSHGLKKHNGNCQRIAHGHRSRIKIWENGKRSRTWEQRWSDKWNDIYLGTRKDLLGDETDLQYRFEYQAPQGKFFLELPAERVYLIDTDSTIEFIAQHVAEEIHARRPDSDIRVKAWEGVRKGAISVAGPSD